MNNPLIRSGQYKDLAVNSVTDKTFLIQYRTKHQAELQGPELLAVNQRIRELHKLTPA